MIINEKNYDKAFKDCEVLVSTYSQQKVGECIVVPENSENGFNFGYVLFLPNEIFEETTLFVEPVNTGKCIHEIEEAKQDVYEKAIKFDFHKQIVCDLKIPCLIPLFPRIYIDNKPIYSHALSSDVLELKNNALEKIDIQLINMIHDAKIRLSSIGINIDEKIIISGFSASAHFANRFTLLHPEIVKLCIAGGLAGVPTLPLAQLENEKLIYPVGIYGIKHFDFEEFSKVKQFYYMGNKDTNDSSTYKEAFRENEKDLLYKILGNELQKRWENSIKIYESLGVNAEFMTYNCDHTPTPAYNDIKNAIVDVLELENNRKI